MKCEDAASEQGYVIALLADRAELAQEPLMELIITWERAGAKVKLTSWQKVAQLDPQKVNLLAATPAMLQAHPPELVSRLMTRIPTLVVACRQGLHDALAITKQFSSQPHSFVVIGDYERPLAIMPLKKGGAYGAIELSKRELQVLSGMMQGKTNGEIGRELSLTENTIKSHACRIYRRLKVQNRAEAVAEAWRLGIVR
ncbi:MAG TPA: LuxR C-terminal-related transcriptional regulator [Candidatus Saccharimonadales bacterium]